MSALHQRGDAAARQTGWWQVRQSVVKHIETIFRHNPPMSANLIPNASFFANNGVHKERRNRMKTLIVVSGGDAPGINAVLYHFTLLAAADGNPVVGALESFAGLLAGQMVALDPASLAPWAAQGGTFLTSSRTPALATDDARDRLRAILHDHQIDNLVLMGGNGTLTHIPPLLSDWGIPYIGIPTTIDNDVPGTEQTIGFDSACNFAYRSVDGIIATARAMPGRIFTLETLGGSTGFIALAVANGAGAHAVLMPEYDFTLAWLSERVRWAIDRDRYALVVLSEGTPGRDTLTRDLADAAGVRVRDVRLGHAQRGGQPSHQDRTLAVNLAQSAYERLLSGGPSGILLLQNGQIHLHTGSLTDFPQPLPDRNRYKRINGLS